MTGMNIGSASLSVLVLSALESFSPHMVAEGMTKSFSGMFDCVSQVIDQVFEILGAFMLGV
jgi:hypothetical protein